MHGSAWLLSFLYNGQIRKLQLSIKALRPRARAPPINLNFFNFGLIGGKNDGIQPSESRIGMDSLEG